MQTIPVLCGPTASGKTALSLEMADIIDAEIVSADSRQVFRFMDIGTAKPTALQRQARPHHLIDVANPDEEYNSGRFAREATEAIRGILSRGKIPLVVGGSGLYLRALMQGLSPMPAVPPDVRLRIRDEIQAAGPEASYWRLREVDPESASRIDPHDLNKIGRALEIFAVCGTPFSVLQKLPRIAPPWKWWVVYLDRPRPELYEAINQRTLSMASSGLFEEVRSLLDRYDENCHALNTVGYKESIEYLKGRCRREQALAFIQLNTRHYAKRQETWFRKSEIHWRTTGTKSGAADLIRHWRKAAGLPGADEA